MERSLASLDLGGRTHLEGVVEQELFALGITAEHSRRYHPQTCGKVERFHQTLKRLVAAQKGIETKLQLQRVQESILGASERTAPVGVWITGLPQRHAMNDIPAVIPRSSRDNRSGSRKLTTWWPSPRWVC